MLARLKQLKQPIRVGIVGIGAMGKGLVYQTQLTPNMNCVAIADIHVQRAIACAEWLGRPFRFVSKNGDMHDAIRQGALAICEDGNLVASCTDMDVFVESSSSIIPAAQFSIAAIEHGKHLVLMNAEVDLIFGPYLMQLAREQGVVYTSCDGDQPGIIKRLVDELELWGFELVMAGNIKGFLDRYSNPTNIIPEADKRNLDYHMATAYTDGTKLCIEMALVANAIGLSTTTPGMHGPRARHVSEALTLFDLPALWQDRRPFVDYILGAEPGGGVFAIGYCTNQYQQDMLAYYKMGTGPFYLFYRPYHLCHVEAMQCIMEAQLDGRSLLEPVFGLRTNVFAYAKRPLRKGETLDGLGGYCCYGLIENNDLNHQNSRLPICLGRGLVLKHDLAQDDKICWEDVDDDRLRFDIALYEKMLVASAGVQA